MMMVKLMCLEHVCRLHDEHGLCCSDDSVTLDPLLVCLQGQEPIEDRYHAPLLYHMRPHNISLVWSNTIPTIAVATVRRARCAT